MPRAVRWYALFAVAAAAAACGRSAFDDGRPRGIATPPPTGSSTLSPTPTATATAVTLIAEPFVAVALDANPDVTWSDDSGGGFELYDAAGAGARGMKGTYDADDDPNTAQVNLLGGLEVNDSTGNVLLTARFTLPAAPAGTVWSGGTMTLWAGNRGSPAGNQTIEVFDLTAGTTVTGVIDPTLPTGTAPREWIYNQIPVPFSNANAGHTIEVRFQGAGTSAEGLELTDLRVLADATI